ncbi:MAG: serine/threonine protein kinase, partial [Planctomycetota bacterium]
MTQTRDKRRFAHFEYDPVDDRLGEGPLSAVYRARDVRLERTVALKILRAHVEIDPEANQRFEREARHTSNLVHPSIATIYEYGEFQGERYIAMEYLQGRTLDRIIKDQLLGLDEALRIALQVTSALALVHRHGLIHRDLKPANIMVLHDGSVKLLDFGIARARGESTITQQGMLVGTVLYMSPEQVRGARIDHRSDIFAVGLVMYEMLTGVRAFERDSSLKTLKAIVQEKPLNPREMNPEIPMEVVKILSKALEKNPDRRYKSAQEFQLAIEDWLEQSPKKSNNVRLSRFLYDLFDDELNSAEGTMVVKGVGQVVIPTNRGMKLKPVVEEEVD